MKNDNDIHGYAWKKVREQVLRDENVCYLCGRIVDKSLPPSNPWSASVDHVVARANDGDMYSRANLRLCHKRCNSMKSDVSIQEARYRINRERGHSRDW